MKSNLQATPYFPSYPLKALNLSKKEPTNNSNIQTPGMIGRLRILPMTDPYFSKKISINKIKLPQNISPAGDNWYNNYE